MCLKLCWEQKVKTMWTLTARSTHQLAKDWDVGVELESGGLMLAMTSDSQTDPGQVTWPFWACFLVRKVRVHTRSTSSSV